MPQQLPPDMTLDGLDREAAALLDAARAGDIDYLDRVRVVLGPQIGDPAELQLHDARQVIAAEFGFDRWGDLRAAVGQALVEREGLHRWFGAQLNNAVWDHLAAAPDAEAPDDLLYAAFASAYHWRQAGTAANAARAEHLIARAALESGRPEVALHHAQRCLDLVDRDPDTMEDWDRAFALEALARAQAASGDPAAAQATFAAAVEATSRIEDPDDRAVVEGELAAARRRYELG